MSSTVLKRFATFICFAIVFNEANLVLASTTATEASVVAQLYKDYSWQAFADQTELFGKDIAHQRKTVLDRYFAPPLTALLLQDARCQIETHGVCNLEIDLLFASQDPSVTDLEIERLLPGKVGVTFKNSANGAKSEIDFQVVSIRGKWKIADIIYKDKDTGDLSLRTLLSHKIQ